MQELATQYDVLKVIGHGGFSAVFKARAKHPPHNIVALKQLDFTIEDEASKEYKDFKEEVEILKKLNHQNIVKVYGEHILDNKPSLEMEFIDGENLETILKKEKYFSIEDTLDVIEQIASALSYCHHYHIPDELAGQSDSALLKRNTVVHNDINPKNIIRTKTPTGAHRYVLIDFGLSFTDPDAVRHSKKEEGMAEYKSPEKWAATTVDTPSDIYSFGIVIYELLAGTVPFPVKDYKLAGDMIALEEKHKSAAIPDICQSRISIINDKEEIADGHCDIPSWLELLIKKCLEKDPAKRFKTGRELLQFYYQGLDGKIDETTIQAANEVIDIDPATAVQAASAGPYLQVEPNFLTPAQHFFLTKNITTIGRYTEAPGTNHADFAIQTADKFISKNHCQIIKKIIDDGKTIYQLRDAVPSKNGTYYNTQKNTHRLQPAVRVNLKEGDYFWVGNTQIIFHE